MLSVFPDPALCCFTYGYFFRGGLASLDVLIRADGEARGKVSLAYFHDQRRVVTNVVKK